MAKYCNSNNTSSIIDVVLANDTLPADLAVSLYGIALPIILLVTIVANTLIVAILAQRHMRSPTNIILIAISISDLMTLMTPAPLFFYMYSLGFHEMPIFPVTLCYAWYFFYDIIPNTFHTCSIWLTLALGLQRYIYVCRPHLARVYCNISKAKKIILFIVIASISHQFVRFFEFRYEETCIVWDGDFSPACTIYHSDWVAEYLDIYYGTYFWFRVICVHLLPCTLLIVLNILLFNALKKAERKRRRLLKENKRKKCSKLRDSNCTTMMLIVILSIFIITEIPLAIITLLHILNSQGYIRLFNVDDYYLIKKFFVASNFFISLSYPINFAVYCGMSRQFLDTFRKTFLCSQSTENQNAQDMSAPYYPRSSVTALTMRQSRRFSSKTAENIFGTFLGQSNNPSNRLNKKEKDVSIVDLDITPEPKNGKEDNPPATDKIESKVTFRESCQISPVTKIKATEVEASVSFHKSEDNEISPVSTHSKYEGKLDPVIETQL